MKTAVTSLIVATVAALALAGCESAEDKAKAAAERPNADGPTAEEVAARVTTPSVSMTPAEREEFRLKTVSLLDDVGADRAEGHTRTPGIQDQVVAMQPLQSHNFTVPMTQGTPYLIFAVCDGDCTVVDLSLLDSTGKVIKSDTDSGDFPVLDFTPSAAGTFTVKMTMTNCKLAPCYAGARVYQKS